MPETFRKYLQQRSTKLFLRSDGTFTPDISEAVTIQTVSEALQYCRNYGLKGMDILMRFCREEYDVRLEIGDMC